MAKRWKINGFAVNAFAGIFLLIVIVPVLYLLVSSIITLLTTTESETLSVIPDSRQLALFWRSFLLSFETAILSLIIGVIAAIFLWRQGNGPFYYLRWLILIPLAIPPFMHSLSWNLATSSVIDFLSGLGLESESFDGWNASVWVTVMSLLPIQTGLTLMALESIEGEKIESARIYKSEFQVVTKVVFPLAMPVVLAASGLIFILSLTDYSVPTLYQVNVYSFEIFADYASEGSLARAFFLSVPMLMLSIIVIYFSQAGIRNAFMTVSVGTNRKPRLLNVPYWFNVLMWATMTVVASQFLVPVITLITGTGSLDSFNATMNPARDEIYSTLKFAAIAAGFCIPLVIAAGKLLSSKGLTGKFWWLMVTAPLAIPAPLAGISLIAIWNRPELNFIYSSSMMPVLAALMRFVPIGAILIYAWTRRIDTRLYEVASIFKLNPIKKWFLVDFKLLMPGIMAAMAAVFILTSCELGATLLVTPAGQTTLTMRIYNYLHYGSSENVAALNLLLVIILLIAVILAMAVWALAVPGLRSNRKSRD